MDIAWTSLYSASSTGVLRDTFLMLFTPDKFIQVLWGWAGVGCASIVYPPPLSESISEPTNFFAV